MTNGIVEFIEDRLNEDETVADVTLAITGDGLGMIYDPAHVRRQVDAMRKIVELHPIHDQARGHPYCATCVEEPDNGLNFLWWPCPTIRALAAIWANHPDYRDEWKP